MSPRTHAATLTAAYYAVIFAALGAHLPFWPVWLAEWGLDEAEIAQFLGAATLARIIGGTVLPAIADRFAIRRGMIAGAAACASLSAFVMLIGIGDRTVLWIITVLGAIMVAPTIPLGDALSVRAAERHGFAYAPVRAAGSIGFLVANVAVGATIGQFGPDLVLWVMGIGFAGVAVLGLLHPGGGAAAGAGLDRTSMAELGRLAVNPVFLLFGIAAALGQGAHAVFYAYSVLDWQARGIDSSTIGLLWAFGVAVETAFMLTVGRAWIARLGPSGGLALAALAGVLRWAAMAFGPEGAVLWPLQALHALTFAAGHLAAIAFIAAAIPPRLVASAQGISTGVVGGSIHAAILFLAAAVLSTGGIGGAYGLATAAAGLSLVLCLLLARVWHGSLILAEDVPEA